MNQTKLIRKFIIGTILGFALFGFIPMLQGAHSLVQTSELISASGTWSWRTPATGGYFDVTKLANGNIFISADADEVFTGTFDGTAYDVFILTVHSKGFATGQGRTLFTGTVLGKSGTLLIQWTGNTKNDADWWWFKWMILSGTGELANLHGQGASWGPGPAGVGVWGGVDYTGKIFFAPN
ncbi:MAG: DUF3224 domain-containing protein [Candidatus Hermodarchaeota archaeon]